jgi:orotate phosphoribosyltransferase
MEQPEILSLLSTVGAVLTGDHFVYTSGQHGSTYINKDALYPHTKETDLLCRQIAQRYTEANIDAVIGPVVGAVILAYAVARNLSDLTSRDVLCLYAEKTADDGFTIKRGYDKLIRGKRVLVVEDVLTTGQSVRKVVQAVRAAGGEVAAVAALCNRGGVDTTDLADVPELLALVEVQLDTWHAEDCPLCARGVPVNTEVGKGREYLARKQ